MARTDPLDQTDPLKPARFGHAPALWLALPLLAGCAWDAYANPNTFTNTESRCICITNSRT